MKVIVATALAAAVLATPALAATRARHQPAYQAGADQATVVISGDKVLGQDPDPAVRTQIRQQGDVSEY